MGKYRFGRFRFDAARRALYDGDDLIALRPKTAALLAVLLQQAGHTVSKADLIEQVWQRRQVQDQSLFQAISELRAALKPLDAIRTQPNLGYEWVLPLRTPQTRSRLARAAAIALLLLANGAVLLGTLGRDPRTAGPETVEYADALPALRAFSMGLEHLHHERFEHAGKYFALATQENPEFLEAHLMAAESLLAAGDADGARTQARALMLRATSTHNNYLLMATLDLLSRADLTDGNPRSALDLARAAAGNASQEGYACAALAIGKRVRTLVAELAATDSAPPASEAPVLAQVDDSAAQVPTPQYCEAISPRTGGPQIAPTLGEDSASTAFFARRRDA